MFHLFPNPSANSVQLTLNAKATETITIQVVDFSGKIVLEKKQQTSNGANNFELNLTQLSNGVYQVKVFNQSNVQVEKLIIQR